LPTCAAVESQLFHISPLIHSEPLRLDTYPANYTESVLCLGSNFLRRRRRTTA
jgi:hypothetical protein